MYHSLHLEYDVKSTSCIVVVTSLLLISEQLEYLFCRPVTLSHRKNFVLPLYIYILFQYEEKQLLQYIFLYDDNIIRVQLFTHFIKGLSALVYVPHTIFQSTAHK